MQSSSASSSAEAPPPPSSKDQEMTNNNNNNNSNTDTNNIPLVLQDLPRFLSHGRKPLSLFDKNAMAVPVAAISALLCVVQRSKAETMMGLQAELKEASSIMIENFAGARSQIAVQSGCELFLRYITRTFLELPDFSACRAQILERGERFQMISLAARDRIAAAAAPFIPAGAKVLTLGWSRVVAAIFQQAAAHVHFDVIILEGRPDASGAKSAACYAAETNIPVKVVLDAAMAYYMESVDLVLVGAQGVLENGGVVNKVGTAAVAACAKAAGKPFYVAAESYKFARMYPLRQSDLPRMPTAGARAGNTKNNTNNNNTNCIQFVDTTPQGGNQVIDLTNASGGKGNSITVENPPVDFTHSKYITLLFTDLGVLTPSAVSDELIRLYQ